MFGAWAHFDAEARSTPRARATRARARARRCRRLPEFRSASRTSSTPRTIRRNSARRYSPGGRPSADAFVVSQLKAAGAIILGKTVTTELAFFGPGKTRNPHDLQSARPAARRRARRQPSPTIRCRWRSERRRLVRSSARRPIAASSASNRAFGYASRRGVLAQSPPLDTIGGYARSVEDIALLLDAISASMRRIAT